jgi:hypothetical protein
LVYLCTKLGNFDCLSETLPSKETPSWIYLFICNLSKDALVTRLCLHTAFILGVTLSDTFYLHSLS